MFAVLALLVSAAVAFAAPPVTEKVLQKFKASFPAVQEVTWYEGSNYYEAYFEKDNVKYHLFYDKEGRITGSRNYYVGEKLCPFLKAKVAEKYPGKTIFGVTEITTGEERYYVMALEDEKTWTNIRVDAVGQIQVLDKMQKAEK